MKQVSVIEFIEFGHARVCTPRKARRQKVICFHARQSDAWADVLS
ncbi:MAG: hypothetical protein ABJQ94_07445 [Roseobacter sp.]